MKRLPLLVGVGAGAGVGATTFWMTYTAPPCGLLGSVLVLVGAVLAVIRQARLVRPGKRRAAYAAASGAAQVAVFLGAGWCGRWYFHRTLVGNLEGYATIVDALRRQTNSATYGGRAVIENPRPDIGWADIQGTEASFVVRLKVLRHPRGFFILFPKNESLVEGDGPGRCLQELGAGWYWYVGCSEE